MFFTWSYNSYFANEQVLVALSVPVHYVSIVFNTIYNNHATIIDFVWYDYCLRNNHGFTIMTIIMHLFISQHY